MAMQASQAQALARSLRAQSTIRLAYESDSYLVRQFFIDARGTCADARLLCEAALEPLISVLQVAATGELPRAEWKGAIVTALKAAMPHEDGDGEQELVAVRTKGELLAVIAKQVPPDAHARRLERALIVVREHCKSSPPSERAPMLLQLLRGATCSPSSTATPASLRQEILDEIATHAHPPLALDGLVQAPCLAALDASGGDGGGNGDDCPHDSAAASSRPPAAPDVSDTAARAIFLAAAELARRGDQRGPKHGCLLISSRPEGDAGGGSGDGENAAEDDWRRCILGEGWNHEVFEKRCSGRKRAGVYTSGGPSEPNLARKHILHAECHAVADAIRRRGEANALAALASGETTAWIVELKDEVAYDDAPPCRKCACLLRAVGVTKASHSTRDGSLAQLAMPPHRPDLLAEDMAAKPLMYACDDLGIRCERLEEALRAGAGAAPAAAAAAALS